MRKDYDDLIWRLRHCACSTIDSALMKEAAEAIEELLYEWANSVEAYPDGFYH